MRYMILIFAMFGLSACATSSTEIDPSGEPALRLAQLLEETALTHPERIAQAQSEMWALEMALLRAPAEASIETTLSVDAAASSNEMAIGPAPDLIGARSVMHAVHLTSYRRLEHAQIGWQQLQVQLPALVDLQARIETVQLDEGEFMRLKAGPLDTRHAAQAFCGQAEAVGLWCQPTHFSGTELTD